MGRSRIGNSGGRAGASGMSPTGLARFLLFAAPIDATDHPPVARPRFVVLGLGNTLLGDDAAGPLAVEAFLAAYEVPEGVEVLDLGTPGLDLTPYLLDRDAVLVVDTVALDAPAGTVRRVERDEVLASDLSPRVSPHDPGVQEALHRVELATDRRLDVSLVGIVPLQHELGEPPSPEVCAALPRAAEEIRRWLAEHGLEPSPRHWAPRPRGASEERP